MEKAKKGLLPGEGEVNSSAFGESHKVANKSENKVNGNTKGEDEQMFTESDGTKTRMTIDLNYNGSITVRKKTVEQ